MTGNVFLKSCHLCEALLKTEHGFCGISFITSLMAANGSPHVFENLSSYAEISIDSLLFEFFSVSFLLKLLQKFREKLLVYANF